MNAISNKETVVPTKEDAEIATESSRVLASAANPQQGLRVHLDGGKELVLPAAVRRLLTHILTEMGKGNAVTLMPVHAELTTQQAAEYLGVSRPYLVKLLKANEITFHKVGSHRRIKFEDVRAYKAKQERESEQAKRELAAEAQEMDMGY